MSKLPKPLEAKRYELETEFYNLYDGTFTFGDGFNACYAELSPLVEAVKEIAQARNVDDEWMVVLAIDALKSIADIAELERLFPGKPSYSTYARALLVALEALEKYKVLCGSPYSNVSEDPAVDAIQKIESIMKGKK
jgi:hypothetical protein